MLLILALTADLINLSFNFFYGLFIVNGSGPFPLVIVIRTLILMSPCMRLKLLKLVQYVQTL